MILGMQLPSNPIPEDKYISILGQETNEIKWMLFGIYDGHAGWETAAALLELFVLYIVHELEAVSSSGFSSNGM